MTMVVSSMVVVGLRTERTSTSRDENYKWNQKWNQTQWPFESRESSESRLCFGFRSCACLPPFLLPAPAAVPEMWAKCLFIMQVLDRLIRNTHDRQSSCALAVGIL